MVAPPKPCSVLIELQQACLNRVEKWQRHLISRLECRSARFRPSSRHTMGEFHSCPAAPFSVDADCRPILFAPC